MLFIKNMWKVISWYFKMQNPLFRMKEKWLQIKIALSEAWQWRITSQYTIRRK